MICYKDKTFCSDAHRCKNSDSCYRNLTEEDEQKAYDLGLGIAISSFKDDCQGWKEKENE